MCLGSERTVKHSLMTQIRAMTSRWVARTGCSNAKFPWLVFVHVGRLARLHHTTGTFDAIAGHFARADVLVDSAVVEWRNPPPRFAASPNMT